MKIQVCGICGDAYNIPEPRPHELGGTFGLGVITAEYLPGATIATTTQLTASHLGYWEFKLCPDPTNNDQACFDQYVLQLENGETKYYPTNGSTTYNVNYKLPAGLVCDHCVLQWRYRAGNNWGICSNGTTGSGCGKQEEFRACSDITIGIPKTLNEEVNEIPSSLFHYLKNGYKPASRASAWRLNFATPPNYDDDGLNCGGFSTQWESNGGKCGICGDAYNIPEPRPNELGGTYGLGVITAEYLPGATIATTTQLTASHLGYWEFKLCPDPTNNDQACFDQHVLQLENGETKYYPTLGSTTYNVNYKLPAGLVCENCVLQWRYRAGNNWGICSNGTTGLGCGKQEEFRACSDITIGIPKTLNEEVNEIPSSLFFYLKNGYFDKQQGLLHLLKGPEKPLRPRRPSKPSKPSRRQPRPARYNKRRKQKMSRSKKRKKTQYWK
ncbi:hypothetical protein MSG28_013474 [Choristoneura fumiferana]|uniref:Uncharacterized protein n=1 Tax=Choristoneura fumiferana TaxID=7141 RepID=A0ACC0KTL8_CHOFU|nr:hypothetical protein MSG28_013474 [Choristoneura fumiferana]